LQQAGSDRLLACHRIKDVSLTRGLRTTAVADAGSTSSHDATAVIRIEQERRCADGETNCTSSLWIVKREFGGGPSGIQWRWIVFRVDRPADRPQ
jgi:hypothetical protein